MVQPMIVTKVKSFIHYVGRRGFFLIFFAFLWFSTGMRWVLEPPVNTNYHVLYKTAEPSFWGGTMLVTALAMAIGAFWKRYDALSFFFSAWVSSFFGTMVLATFLPNVPGPEPTGVTVVITYFLYAILAIVISGWPEAKDSRSGV